MAGFVHRCRAKLSGGIREPGDAESEPGGEVKDLWVSMPHVARDFQASLVEDERVTEEVSGRDDFDPMDFYDLPVF